MKNIAIIYHDADFDGKLSNEVCRYWLGRRYANAAIHSYGWDYGRPTPVPDKLLGEAPPTPVTLDDWRIYDAIYIVDLSVDELMARPELRDKIVWIDHHKSAMEKWDKLADIGDKPYPYFQGYRIDGVAACRLCWQWFTQIEGDGNPLPSKQDYINRAVTEPELIRLAGEYDIWDHRDPDAKALQFGLRAVDTPRFQRIVEEAFSGDLQPELLLHTIRAGHSIKSYADKQADEYSAAFTHTVRWEGLLFCCLNIGQRGNSDLLRGGIKPEHDACFAWRYDGKQVIVSLYHIAGKEHHDLSLIAVKYKGGGHRGACGFRVSLRELEEILEG